MKFKLFSIGALVSAMLFASFTAGPNESIAIGTEIPMMKMKLSNSIGGIASLEDLKKENGLLVIFSCNTCPFVIGGGSDSEGWEGRYADLYKNAEKRNIGMVLINSNEARRTEGDSFDDMKKHAKAAGYDNIPYLLDNNHVIADAFGAKTTPHVFLFDGDKKLIYKGAIDDNMKSAEAVTETWLLNAIKSCPTGTEFSPNETKATGCSIKRVN